MNITQLMVFSNNMEYEDGSPLPIEGAFYSTASYQKPNFNYFREEEKFDLDTILSDITDDVENLVLKDNNLISIKNSAEFATNKDSNSPTNTICTSLFKRDRLAFLLEFSLAYLAVELLRKSYNLQIIRPLPILITQLLDPCFLQPVKSYMCLFHRLLVDPWILLRVLNFR